MCCHGLELTEHTQGTEGVMTLINLALITGNLGRAGSGVNPLRGQNNVQGAGLSYARLEKESLHWPCPAEDHPGTPVLHGKGFAGSPHAALRRIGFRTSPEVVDDAFPWLLTTGRSIYHFNSGTMTGHTDNMLLEDSDYLEICAEDAQRMHFPDGEQVRVRSRHGEVVLPLRISGRVQPGQLFTTFHMPALKLNRVTSPWRDNVVQTPEYKVTAVALSRAIAG